MYIQTPKRQVHLILHVFKPVAPCLYTPNLRFPLSAFDRHLQQYAASLSTLILGTRLMIADMTAPESLAITPAGLAMYVSNDFLSLA